ncbi:hypothetical protein MVG78_04030 [Roseomonas gilardii subsp. gilardii]|uniref:hypothetical protein n=1 Tax=Roseomonas gilardii TaxID=257708 RepID=UPI001FFB5C5D|nr:hypothetical protein [Roseomonas gilardii]UPG73334.1 hypothetical protein MVG78_04030 [Roseomonas gilardii subsp. gilardii]
MTVRRNLPGLTRRRIGAGLLAASAGAAAGWIAPARAAPGAGGAEGQGMQAMAADSLVDSIGVNIHCWPGNSYIEGDRWEKVILPALRELRIRHARDGVGLDRGVLTRLRQVAQLGIRLTLLSGPEATSSVELSRALDEVGRENIAMLEGVNEPDGWWGGRPGHTPEMAIDHQRILSGIGRARDIPVIASALIQAGNRARFARQAPYAEYGNIHPYPAGRMPETGGWGDNGYGSLRWARDLLVTPLLGAKAPFVATEVGYHNAITQKARTTNPHSGCPEPVSAAYEPRLFLYYRRFGVARSFKYEFFDQGTDKDDPEQNFGWLRHDGSRKPAFHAMRNLIAAFSDPGPAFAPARLPVNLSGETEGLETCLFQKRDGSFLLALWLAKSLWDVHSFTETPVPPQEVRIAFGDRVRQAAVNRPNEDARFQEAALSGGGITLPVTAQVTLLRLTPR